MSYEIHPNFLLNRKITEETKELMKDSKEQTIIIKFKFMDKETAFHFYEDTIKYFEMLKNSKRTPWVDYAIFLVDLTKKERDMSYV